MVSMEPLMPLGPTRVRPNLVALSAQVWVRAQLVAHIKDRWVFWSALSIHFQPAQAHKYTHTHTHWWGSYFMLDFGHPPQCYLYAMYFFYSHGGSREDRGFQRHSIDVLCCGECEGQQICSIQMPYILDGIFSKVLLVYLGTVSSSVHKEQPRHQDEKRGKGERGGGGKTVLALGHNEYGNVQV